MSERTLLIVKPDGVARGLVGEVIARVEARGFRLCAIQMLRLDDERAGEFYAIHRGKPFYRPLVEFMTSGPVVVVLLEADRAVQGLRELVGVTDPAKAEIGTVRGDMGTTIQANVVHASDSPETARAEIGFFFGPRALSGCA
ncbi:nucleoside diphosphate kinase [candidate division TA06 bacterium DG_24]|uniref:Nucleoside diphosphate kinase n=3 Tax=Bacteria division TA06 TaxID=1156500 RepID=A0A0S8JF77_UNCT6|nr:MAG: nucleoside diphosphate kinase [candidate division TA06 bacterium DG_24]KPK68917.1 MAG: nucleoside diphosphate kinase [candidate division TA06 bacterium SM23_40]KPL08441.1 MAG: nucleoside diphosphate kinase [candidate division TA06 bacterium SM1_40]